MARNFAALTLAEATCRVTSVAVTLVLARRLGREGFGRAEFAFNVVLWLVILVREGFELFGTREVARHPRRVPVLVRRLLPIRMALAVVLLAGLVAVASLTLSRPLDRAVLGLYGLLLITTAAGLDFVFRGLERMTLIAVSLIIRTAVYATCALSLVRGPETLAIVPICLVIGEALGISLVWVAYVRRFGWPIPPGLPTLARFARTQLRRARSTYIIPLSQALLSSLDLVVVGLLSQWVDVGLYSAPHRLVAALLTFGLIVQQAAFPALARSWQSGPAAGREALDRLVRLLMIALVPLAVGGMILADPLVHWLFRPEYAPAGILLAIGIWRVPLLALAFLYQTARVALVREPSGSRWLILGAIASGPLVAAAIARFGLVGAVSATVVIAAALAAGGYLGLHRDGRAPAWHHHLARPALASLAMVPACLLLKSTHVVAAIAAGGAAYAVTLALIGGLNRSTLIPDPC
jgi:O-antigen/teichoic acid export membrane protein